MNYGNVKIVQGMLPYLAPEIRFMPETQATIASDMWSVGCIGYEMCIGLRLSEGHVREIENHVHGDGLDLSRIPARFGSNVRKVISLCLARDPNTRIDASSLQGILRGLISNSNSGHSTQQGHVHQAWPPAPYNFPKGSAE